MIILLVLKMGVPVIYNAYSLCMCEYDTLIQYVISDAI